MDNYFTFSISLKRCRIHCDFCNQILSGHQPESSGFLKKKVALKKQKSNTSKQHHDLNTMHHMLILSLQVRLLLCFPLVSSPHPIHLINTSCFPRSFHSSPQEPSFSTLNSTLKPKYIQPQGPWDWKCKKEEIALPLQRSRSTIYYITTPTALQKPWAGERRGGGGGGQTGGHGKRHNTMPPTKCPTTTKKKPRQTDAANPAKEQSSWKKHRDVNNSKLNKRGGVKTTWHLRRDEATFFFCRQNYFAASPQKPRHFFFF